VIIDIASPLGGQPPIDPKVQIHLRLLKTQKDLTKILNYKLKVKHKLADVKQADYDAVLSWRSWSIMGFSY
jgi:hypothetical protein